MIRFQVLGVRFTLPLLTLIFPFLAMQLGMNGDITSLMFALGIHEFAHVLAAGVVGVRIQEIRLMPFGGSARMENPYDVPARRIIPVAAAGPAANLLLAILFSALVQWRMLPAQSASGHVRHNLVLCLFNLLPALPLDGGRITYALLQQRFGEKAALTAGLWLGRLLAAALLLAAIAGGIVGGRWNLSFMLAAIFIFASQRDEYTALYKSRAERLLQLQADTGCLLPVRIFRTGSQTTVQEALNLLRPKEDGWFAIIQHEQIRILTSENILAHILQNGTADARLCELAAPAHGLQSAAPKA